MKLLILLPYPDFHESINCFSEQTLDHQLLSARALFSEVISRKSYSCLGAQMWRGFEPALVVYGYYLAQRAVRYNKHYLQTLETFNAHLYMNDIQSADCPEWFEQEEVHKSHRCFLIRKQPEFYSRIFSEPIDTELVWPI